MFGLIGEVINLIEEWQPKKWHRNEKGFQQELATFLRKKLQASLFGPKPKVVTESRIDRADIQVGKDIGIEMKINLTRSKMKKLVGQIEMYPFSNIIAVVCGVKDEDAWEELKEKYESGVLAFGEKHVTLIRKDKSREKRKEKRGLFELDLGI